MCVCGIWCLGNFLKLVIKCITVLLLFDSSKSGSGRVGFFLNIVKNLQALKNSFSYFFKSLAILYSAIVKCPNGLKGISIMCMAKFYATACHQGIVQCHFL